LAYAPSPADSAPAPTGLAPAEPAPPPAPTHGASPQTTPADPAPEDHPAPPAARRITADLVAAAAVVAVTPLCLLQAPNAIAWALTPVGGVTGGPGTSIAVLRAAGLALPAMAGVAGIAGLAVIRWRAWPVLLTGLLIMAVADVFGGSAHTVAMIGVVRVLHGLAAGLALPAALGLAWERRPRPRRLLAALWAAATVAGLAGVSAVARERLASGGWHGALAPYPWLTGVALTVAALYAILADGPGAPRQNRRPRQDPQPSSTLRTHSSHKAHSTHPHQPPRAPRARQDATQERAQLAVLTVPGLGLGALSVGVTYRSPLALLAAGAVAVLILYGVAAVASADRLVGGPLCFPMVAAVTGLVVAPAAGAVTSLRDLTSAASGPAQSPPWLPLGVTVAAVAAGVVVALMLRRRPRPVVLAGLVVALEGLAAARLAGPFVPGLVLAGVSAPLAGGLAAALTAALTGTAAKATAASALSGASLLLGGLLTGYLAAGAVQVRMVTQLAAGPGQGQGNSPGYTQAGERLALAGAVGVWELVGLVSVLIAIAVIILTGRARRAGAVTR
jgi:MFS family permease